MCIYIYIWAIGFSICLSQVYKLSQVLGHFADMSSTGPSLIFLGVAQFLTWTPNSVQHFEAPNSGKIVQKEA